MSFPDRPRADGAEVRGDSDFTSAIEARDFFRRENQSLSGRDGTQFHGLAGTQAGEIPDPRPQDQGSQNGQAIETVVQPPNPPTSDNPWSRKTLLTLDGGGVRGYSSLLILQALMTEIRVVERKIDPCAMHSVYPLRQRYRKIPPPPKTSSQLGNGKSQTINFSSGASSSPYIPSHYFDYVAGTSTGGLIAIMLGRLSMTVEECLEAYEQLADVVFGQPRRFHVRRPPFIPPRPKYNSQHLSKVIKEIVRQRNPEGLSSTTFEQPHEDMCRTIVVAWQSWTLTGLRVPYLFRSYFHPKSVTENVLERNPNVDHYYPISRVGLATTAAPTYFESVKLEEGEENYKFEFIDGGFGANNPSEEAYRSVKQLFRNDKNSIGLLLSVGTGKNQEASTKPRTGYRKIWNYINAAAAWATDSEHIHHNVLDALADVADYYRLNVEHGLGKMKLDAWKGDKGVETLTLIGSKTREYLATTAAQEMIRKSAKTLVAIRRARAYCQDTDRWERFCHGVKYRCPEKPCTHGDKFFLERQYFRSHLEKDHEGCGSEDAINRILDNGKIFRQFPNLSPDTFVQDAPTA